MSIWLIALVAMIHALVAVEQALLGHPGMAIVFLGYAIAGAGLMAAAL